MSSSKTANNSKDLPVVHHEWHALPQEAVIEVLHTSVHGLTDIESTIRTGIYGENSFIRKSQNSFIKKLFDQFRSPLTLILIVAAGITFALGEYVDTGVITFALLIAVFVGIYQEGRASRSFEKLRDSQVHSAIVVRDGKRHEILATELVPGDVVVLQSGMLVPADIRLLSTKKLMVNEAVLTGEWVAVSKDSARVSVGAPFAEQKSMVWMGTSVAEGYGEGIVVAIGNDTNVGTLAEELGDIESEITPLQHEMAEISRMMLLVIIILVTLIFIIGIARNESLEIMLLTSVAIAVASIPEGLPAAVTIILAVGMEALLKRGGLVRNLLAAETLGSTTYILTDKTGTLTEGRMAITDVAYLGCANGTSDKTCNWADDEHARVVFDTALCASDAFLDEKKNEGEEYIVRGAPMERAILEEALEIGVTLKGESARALREDYLAFTSQNRYAAGVTAHNDTHTLCINGAPEYILESSEFVLGVDGDKKMSGGERSHFAKLIHNETKNGKRIIAVGRKSILQAEVPDSVDEVLKELTFVGLLIFDDPVRKGIELAIKGVLNAGAQIRLVTGDNSATALSVARTVGIAHEDSIALTGNDIAELDENELLKKLQKIHVFARVLPRQKLRLARVLQRSGEIVAMTGDGINDAPALQKANIGIAIGSGTEVAKEASDLILVEDSFATIYSAIEEGRRIVANLRKIVGYLLSTSLSEATLIGAALLTGAAIPILPAQILWANIIEEGLMSIAFAFEPGDTDAMKMKPQDIHEEGIVSRDMLLFMGMVIGVLGVLLLILYGYFRSIDTPIVELRSVMFLAISLDSLFIAFSFRSLSTPIWKISLRTNMFFLISFCINVVLLIAVLSIPFLQFLLSYQPLPPKDIAIALIYAFSTMVTIEIGKSIFFEKK